MILTPTRLAAVYECLREFPPFDGWNLPSSLDVQFNVVKDKTLFGFYRRAGGQHEISISKACVGTYEVLARIMAHEMIHLAQNVAKTSTSAAHNNDYHRRARLVCDQFLFDLKAFV